MDERETVLPEPEGLDDRTLVLRALADPDAFALLYERHVRRIFQYLLIYADSPDDAADLTQVTFIRALQALPALRDDRELSFAAWLTRIARNAAIDAFRRRRRTLPWEHVSEAVLIYAGPGPELVAVQRDTLNRLRLLVGALDPEKQEILALRFAAGLTIAEVAAIIDKSEAATRKQLVRTLHTLKGRMKAYGL